MSAAFETNHYAALVFGCYFHRLGLYNCFLLLCFERLDFTGRTPADRVDRLEVGADSLDFKPCDIMHQVKPVSSDIGDCARVIKTHGFRHVPVVDAEGVPRAMISSRDFLRYAVDELEMLISNAYSKQRVEELTDPFSLVD